MGVRGLTTFVNYNQDSFLKTYLLHDSNLVIDGHSLCAQLFRSSNSFPAFGGNYDKFAAYVRTFFKNLKKCNITCYVLFDGGYEVRKLKTAYSRLRSKISGASHLDPVTQSSLQIFPLLLRDTFKEVLRELNIKYSVCELEADDEIAAMARYLNCPVLSYDSDFFIYNVLYIPFNTLEYKAINQENNGNKYYAIECKLFKSEYLVKKFQLQVDLMPLLATLLGNDFVQKRMFKKFFSHLKLPKNRTKKNDQQRSIQALINWLQNETLDSAIAKIIGRVKNSEKSKVLRIVKESIEGYNCKLCKSIKYFNLNNISNDSDNAQDISAITTAKHILENSHELLVPENNDGSDSDTSSDELEGSPSDDENTETADEAELAMPDWLSARIRNNVVPQSYIDLYTLHIHFCVPQAEDYTSEDSFICTLPILRYAFDILTDFKEEHCIYVSRERDNNYKRIIVGQEFAIEKPLLENYSTMSLPDLQSFMSHFIRVNYTKLDLTLIDMLPSNFRLISLSIIWWVKHCNVPKYLVHSVILSYIMLDVIDEYTGIFRGAFFFNNKYSKKIEILKKRTFEKTFIEEGNLFLNKKKVQYDDCLVACQKLLQHFDISAKIKKKPKSYDIKIIHSLAQFQCCLLQFNCLNNLCNNPFESSRYSKFYDGTFIYNLACSLTGSIDIVSHLEKYLEGAQTVLLFYKSLWFVLDKCFNQLGVQMCNAPKQKTRRGKKKNKSDMSFLVEEFASEVYI